MSSSAIEDYQEVIAPLAGHRILLTGGSGFIGGRLAQLLLGGGAASLTLLVRNRARALVRFGRNAGKFRLLQGSLSDAAAIAEAGRGCSLVFNCAYDPADRAANIAGLHSLISGCIQTRARLVHLSTFATFLPLPDAPLTEDMPTGREGDPYAANKLALESQILAAVQERGLEATILLPTVVYGPRAGTWTHGPAQQLFYGTVLLPDNGDGICSAVYVDDVCQAMLRAACSPFANGQRYLISAAEHITWREFFQSYSDMMGRPGPKCFPTGELESQVLAKIPPGAAPSLVSPQNAGRISPRDLAHWAIRQLSPSMKKRFKDLYRRLTPAPIFIPDGQLMKLYGTKCTVVVEKAKAQLGYKPRYDLGRGMAATEAWVRQNIGHHGPSRLRHKQDD